LTRNQSQTTIRQFVFFNTGSKLTAIEVWLIACIFFILVAMIEYGFILLLKTMKNGNSICATTLKTSSNNAWQIRHESTTNCNQQITSSSIQDINRLLKNIDNACLGISALGFLIFNIVYWAVYL
jgi:hypothetical protein